MSVPVGSAFLIDPIPEDIFTQEDFTEQQRAMARTAEEFIDNEVIPRIAEIEEKKPGVVPTLLKRAGDIGLLAIEVPEAYGGLGLDKATAMCGRPASSRVLNAARTAPLRRTQALMVGSFPRPSACSARTNRPMSSFCRHRRSTRPRRSTSRSANCR